MNKADKQAIKAQKIHFKLFKNHYKKTVKLAHKQINKAVKCGKEVTTLYLVSNGLDTINTDVVIEVMEAVKETLIGEGYYIRKHTPLAFLGEIRVSWGSEIANQQQIDAHYEEEAKQEQMKKE